MKCFCCNTDLKEIDFIIGIQTAEHYRHEWIKLEDNLDLENIKQQALIKFPILLETFIKENYINNERTKTMDEREGGDSQNQP